MTEPDSAQLYKRLLNRMVVHYSRLLLAVWIIIPLALIIYIEAEQDPLRLYEDHPFHVVSISLAILLSGFISFVSWRSYLASGEPMLRWITLGFLGFSIVYAPHGFLTHTAHTNPWLFLLYGPASRVVMALCFFVAICEESPGGRCRATTITWLATGAVYFFTDRYTGRITRLFRLAW